MWANIRGTKLFFDIEGAGWVPQGDRLVEKPVAFLLHGGPGADHSSYKPLFSAIADRMQLVYVDHRGQGRSARGNPTTYTLDNNVADLEALRQYLGLERILLVGGSYGGMVAQAYAARYPQALSHLIIYATAASHEFLPRAQQFLATYGTEAQQAIATYLWNGNFETEAQLQEYFQQLAPLYSCRSRTHPDQANAPNTSPSGLDRTILSVDAINQAFGGFLRRFDLRPELPQIQAPTLVMAAEYDWICPPDFSVEIANLIPQAQLRIFENSGHLIRVDQPEALLSAIVEFVG
ncbi:MAG: alpha/beta fold hydrolase [Synechococcales bacterium]|nr:alpha/beta fold hydrolase [Synechococcales bacterium]